MSDNLPGWIRHKNMFKIRKSKNPEASEPTPDELEAGRRKRRIEEIQEERMLKEQCGDPW